MNRNKVNQMFGAASAVAMAAGVLALSGCMKNNMNNSTTTTTTPTQSVLSYLANVQTIGSTVDPMNGDANPYGLAIAPVTAGVMKQGDLIVCNFNDSNGVAGNGTTIEDLSPTPGSMPVRLAQDPSLAGCDALALNTGNGYIWAAAYTAADNPIISPAGALVTSLKTAYGWMHPWGQLYAMPAATNMTALPTFYVTDAGDGSVIAVRISSTGFVFAKIAKGFPWNLTSPNGILAPSGMVYNQASDTLYVVSTANNAIVALSNASTLTDGGIMVTTNQMTGAMTFSGPQAGSAKVLFMGSPLNFPISMVQLYNGDLVAGNTGDNNMVEITTGGVLAGAKNVDSGNAGAIFGMVATGNSLNSQVIYFNDDNSNTVKELSY